jgi:hypothetical protein
VPRGSRLGSAGLGSEDDGIKGETGHFYFGEDRTSVLWTDRIQNSAVE